MTTETERAENDAIIATEQSADARLPSTEDIEAMVSRFLAWPLPQTVCSDLCVTDVNYKFPRSGTNLLTVDEARQMVLTVFGSFSLYPERQGSNNLNVVNNRTFNNE